MKQVQLPPSEAVGRIRFVSERRAFDELSGDELIARVAERLRKRNEEEANRRRLLAGALRITDRIIPPLMERVALVKRITHLEGAEVETYIHNSPHHSAINSLDQDSGYSSSYRRRYSSSPSHDRYSSRSYGGDSTSWYRAHRSYSTGSARYNFTPGTTHRQSAGSSFR